MSIDWMSIDWISFANEFTVFENRSVTLTSVRNTGNVSKNRVPASRGSVRLDVLQAMAPAYVRPRVMYCVRLHKTTVSYKPGDLVIDETQPDATEPDHVGVTYTVEYVDADDAFLILVVFNPKIAFDLQDTVDIYLNETGRDAAGATIIESQQPVYTAVPAKVQLVRTAPQNVEGKFGTLREYSIFLYPYPDTIELGHNHIVAWTNPATGKASTFDVVSYDSSEQYDRLSEVHAEVRP